MARKIFAKKPVLVVLLSLLLTLQCANAFAWGRSHGRNYYRGGKWYRPGWFGFGIAVVSPSIGSIVGVLPIGYTTIIVTGVPYYYYNHVHNWRRQKREKQSPIQMFSKPTHPVTSLTFSYAIFSPFHILASSCATRLPFRRCRRF